MPTAKFIHDGDAIDYRPGTDVASGDVIVQNDLVGIAKRDIPAHTLGALAVTGVFDVPKVPGDVNEVGTTLSWSEADQYATESQGVEYILMGKCVRHAAADDEIVRVRLTQ